MVTIIYIYIYILHNTLLVHSLQIEPFKQWRTLFPSVVSKWEQQLTVNHNVRQTAFPFWKRYIVCAVFLSFLTVSPEQTAAIDVKVQNEPSQPASINNSLGEDEEYPDECTLFVGDIARNLSEVGCIPCSHSLTKRLNNFFTSQGWAEGRFCKIWWNCQRRNQEG